jgi:probable rRNA maturation factor
MNQGSAQQTAAEPLSTMILLDPDLDPDPSPKSRLAKRTAASARSAKFQDLRLPSARTVARFLAQAQAAVRLRGQVTVLLTTDAAIRKLNRQFRGKNKATDVLSFPAEGPGAEEMAGDLAISVTTALGQAAENGHSLSTEIKVLLLHGLLHLAGYDHEVDDGKMARRERLLRARLGLPQGLIERAGTPNASASKKKRVPQVSSAAAERPGKPNTLPGAPSMRRTSVAWVGSHKAPSGKSSTSTRVPSARSARP